MRTVTMSLFCWLVLVGLAPFAPGQTKAIKVEDAKSYVPQSPVRMTVLVSTKDAQDAAQCVLTSDAGEVIACSLSRHASPQQPTREGLVACDLILPPRATLKDGSYALSIKPGKASNPTYRWKVVPGTHMDLEWSTDPAVPVVRYVNAPLDNSSKEKRNQTYKVFHHVFDATGKQLLTNGGHLDAFKEEKDLVFPHHRGFMFAFNKCTYFTEGDAKGVSADTWHCTGEACQIHDATEYAWAGPFAASHVARVAWLGPGKRTFLHEYRRLVVHRHADGVLLDFDIVVTLPKGISRVVLDGDPQHAGFQFRAHNSVATTTAKQTYYLRPDGKGANDVTRNWEPKTQSGPTNLPWTACCFVLGEQRYSTLLMDHPDNPGEKRHSERNYGRFGNYAKHDLKAGEILQLRYRAWVQTGEMTVETARTFYLAYTKGPRVTAVE